MMNDFAAFILTHGRPDRVITYNALRRQGYTGKIIIIIDNDDKKADQYIENFGKDNVIIFDKKKIAETIDEFDTTGDRRAIIYARNAVYDIAKKIGIKYFIQLDDDYTDFVYRINSKLQHPQNFFTVKKGLDGIFAAMLKYYKNTPFASIAMSQGGDWFGGDQQFGKKPKRKAMNSFICTPERPIQFNGRINEDVNTYTTQQARGLLFLTIPFVQLNQLQTQSNDGGMTALYIDGGTYMKSFYTVLTAPSCTRIITTGRTSRRLHHRIKWDNAAPYIIREEHKKEAHK